MTEQGINHNQVEVCGRINSAFEYSHEIFGEGFYTVKLLVNRLSEATDEIPLLISERLVDVTKDYKGMLVRACGQFRSFNKHEENRNHLILSVFVRDLEFIESMDGVRPNQIILDGFICKQPVYRMTPLGREICDILLAVNRSYGKSVKLAPFTVPNKIIKTAGIKNTPRFKYLPCVKGISIEVPVCV